ncbi:MAG: hypothetical protein L0227_18435, partial [Chloroflexi bacterium]|nr:hypothetical protein [Chloroflexota bacterium]
MTDARPAERRRRLRPPPPGFTALWLTLLMLVVAGLHAGTAQEPDDPGIATSQDTSAVPSVQPESAPEVAGPLRRVEVSGTQWWERGISVL